MPNLYVLIARLSLSLTCLALIACDSPGFNCRPLDGWQQGGRGVTALPGCISADYRAAHELGRSRYTLRAEREKIDTQIARGEGDASELRRRQRQIDVDIEAIDGVAVISGWNQAAP